MVDETTINRILDGMADFENRLSFLENSVPFVLSKSPESPQSSQETSIVMTNIRRDEFEQLKNQLTHFVNKVTEMRAIKKKTGYKYK